MREWSSSLMRRGEDGKSRLLKNMIGLRDLGGEIRNRLMNKLKLLLRGLKKN
jgi:hypothetical protein